MDNLILIIPCRMDSDDLIKAAALYSEAYSIRIDKGVYTPMLVDTNNEEVNYPVDWAEVYTIVGDDEDVMNKSIELFEVLRKCTHEYIRGTMEKEVHDVEYRCFMAFSRAVYVWNFRTANKELYAALLISAARRFLVSSISKIKWIDLLTNYVLRDKAENQEYISTVMWKI